MSDEILENQIVEEVYEDAPTAPSEPIVEVGGERIEIKKMNAAKVATVSNIFGELLITGNKKLRDFKAPDNMSVVVGVLAALDEQKLIRLAACMIERDETFVRENFDLSWVLQAIAVQMQVSNLRAVITNFTSLLSQIQ